MKIKLLFLFVILFSLKTSAQTVTALQQQNARATGYAIVAARNPGKSFTVIMIKWDGSHDLEYNANTLINSGWHPQAAVKGNYFNQTFDGSDFTMYSSVIVSQAEFDIYKSTGTDWWIVCSTLPAFSNSGLTILDNGNVGIGSTHPDEKLTVKGKIHAEEIIVDLSVPADYVFQKYYTGKSELKSDYAIPSLAEIESFTKENHHLPNVPSALEIQQNGLPLGEMSNVLLQKVEELTLYAIEQNKEIVRLKKENENYKSLAERLSAIEKKLKK